MSTIQDKNRVDAVEGSIRDNVRYYDDARGIERQSLQNNYQTAMTYGSECWAVKKKDENKLNSAEMRMLRWARGKTRLDHIRNEDIRKEADVKPVETFLENKRQVVWPLLEARTQPHLCEIAKTRGSWEKEQRPTEKEMEGQHTGRHEEIPTD